MSLSNILNKNRQRQVEDYCTEALVTDVEPATKEKSENKQERPTKE